MRSAAKLALGLLAIPLNIFIASATQTGEVGSSVSSIFETNEYTIVRFEAQCSECQATPYANLPLELMVHKTHVACETTGIYLNGDDLVHDWNGNSGHGSGLISALSAEIKPSLTASWESICISIPCDDSEGCMAQVLTVQLEQIDEEDLGTAIRFSFTLAGDRKPELKSLSNHPWRIFEPSYADDEGEFMDCPDHEKYHTNPAEESLETLYNTLHNLQYEVNEIQQRIQYQKRIIREKLAAGCLSNSSITAWKTCTSLPCKVRYTFSLIPNFIRQMRYRFGPLPYPIPDPLCTKDLTTDITTSLNTTANTTAIHQTASSNYITITDHETSLITLPALLILSLLLSIPILITLLICHNATCCLRRRADRAARREERRTRAAYKSAARRLRWRQWLESWGFPFLNSATTTNYAQVHGLSPISGDDDGDSEASGGARPRHPYSHLRAGTGNDETSGSTNTNILATEILTFRQALEYVGDLIRMPIPTPNRERDLESGYPLPDADTYAGASPDMGRNRRRDASRIGRRSRAASSTAGLSTVVSLRTGTMSIPDTETEVDVDVDGVEGIAASESCVTLDTLLSETPPPSYHP
ncbi:hypothetical protein BJY00DRAFT_279401 [Aspergillus carlsbadensis]|nr:hypothetical protein BJY00DRAFT_279401 [Aspergillus carlsbadensis]